MTLAEVKAKVQQGDKIVAALGIKRIYYRVKRNGRKLFTISESQFMKLTDGRIPESNKKETKFIYTL